jgi:hypothetical protein
MKVKIIKDFNISETKVLKPGAEVTFTNDFAKKMIEEGFAEELVIFEIKAAPRPIKPKEEGKEEKSKKGKDKE